MANTLFVCGFHQFEGGDMEIVPCAIVRTAQEAEHWIETKRIAEEQDGFWPNPPTDWDYEEVKFLD